MEENKHSEQRRSEFVNTAEKLFKENGIVDTTISSIVKELDVAKGLFYYYFKSKDDVIEALTDKYHEHFIKMMNQSINNWDFDTKVEYFMDNCIHSFEVLWKEINSNKAENIDLSPIAIKSFEESKQIASKALEELIEEGKRLGKIDIELSKIYSDFIISGIADLVRKGTNDLQQIKEIVIDFIKYYEKENR